MLPLRRSLASLAVAGALVLGTAVTAQGAAPPVAPAPTPEQIAVATNAMLGFDLPAAIDNATGNDARFSTGYTNPPGGQDPLPVCVYGAGYQRVAVPDSRAVGYMARNGFVGQSVYEYPSAAAARRAWSSLDRAIVAHCRGSWTADGDRVTITRSRMAATASAGAGWLVTTTGMGSVTAVAVTPVGDAIQVVSYVRQAATLNARVPATLATLSARLADRWVGRNALPSTQGALLAGAALAALTPADVPAALPVTSPADGGWSSYTASEPGDGPYTCAPVLSLPAGSWSVISDLGGTGDVVAEPGTLMQDVEVYPSNDAARAAWTAVRRAVLRCNDPSSDPWAANGTGTRTVSGVSTLVVDGVPGVWSREFTVYRDIPLSGKVYSIALLSGNVIQTVRYYTTVDRVAQIPLDQAAVNELAVTLLDRWNATLAQAYAG